MGPVPIGSRDIPGMERPRVPMGLLETVPFWTANRLQNWSAFELDPKWNRTHGNEWAGSNWVLIGSERSSKKSYWFA